MSDADPAEARPRTPSGAPEARASDEKPRPPVGPVPRRAADGCRAGRGRGLAGLGAWGHYDRAAEASQTQRQTQRFRAGRAGGDRPSGRTARCRSPARHRQRVRPGDASTPAPPATSPSAGSISAAGSSRATCWSASPRPTWTSNWHRRTRSWCRRRPRWRRPTPRSTRPNSNTRLANVTNGRTSTLANLGWETRQNADNTRLGLAGSQASLGAAQAAVKVAQANLAAQYATVQRLEQLTGYENVTAPFDGVITSRSVDTGRPGQRRQQRRRQHAVHPGAGRRGPRAGQTCRRAAPSASMTGWTPRCWCRSCPARHSTAR